MSQTAPTAVDALPTAPSTSSPSTFSALMDAFLAALATFRTQINNIATNVYNNAVDCYTNAIAAAGSAASAIAASNAVKWVSGTTYADGDGVWSPISYQSYRRIGAGGGTTDPSLDPANWAPLSGGLTTSTVTGTTQTAAAGNRYLLGNVAATTVTMPSGASGAEIEIVPANGLLTNAINFGAATVQGPNGTATGVITLNLGAPLHVIYSSTLTKWVML